MGLGVSVHYRKPSDLTARVAGTQDSDMWSNVPAHAPHSDTPLTVFDARPYLDRAATGATQVLQALHTPPLIIDLTAEPERVFDHQNNTSLTHLLNQSVSDMNSLFPRDQFSEFRSIATGLREFKRLFSLFVMLHRQVSLMAAYATAFQRDVQLQLTTGSSRSQSVLKVKREVDRRVQLYYHLFHTVHVLNDIHLAWRAFKKSVAQGAPAVHPALLMIAYLQPVQVELHPEHAPHSGSERMTSVYDYEIRALNVLNFYIRKWQELTFYDAFTTWLRTAQAQDAAAFAAAQQHMAEVLVKFGRRAQAKHTIVSAELLQELHTELTNDEAAWVQALRKRRVLPSRRPCILFIATHGGMALTSVAQLPSDMSMARIVTVPPGYIYEPVLNSFQQLYQQVKHRYTTRADERITTHDMLALVQTHIGRQVENLDFMQLAYSANMSTQFAKRYLPGENYINKQFSLTPEDVDQQQAGNVDWRITLLTQTSAPTPLEVDVLHAMGTPLGPVTLQDLLSFTRAYQPDMTDVIVIDLSCSTFHSPLPAQSTQQELQSSYLGYESEPETQAVSRAAMQRRMFGGYQ